MSKQAEKRKSGIPIGNAGEYLVMGELLRRDLDAQLADRNTKGYDIVVVGKANKGWKVEVKTSRTHSWFVRLKDSKKRPDVTTVYVHISKDNKKPARFFIVRNRDIKKGFHKTSMWKTLLPSENRWELLM